MKIHLHEEQFDDAWHPWCSSGNKAVLQEVFEATPEILRCARCSRAWFPNGQPDWHFKYANELLIERSK